jgi:multimeric flavodoxin WrbA
MKLLMISGSRNPEGSTARMAEALLKGALSEGIPAERVFLPTLTIERCRQCDAAGWGKCRPEGYCVIEDDLGRVLEMIREADAVVFANPVYFGDLSESLRAFLDRVRRILRHEPARQGVEGKPAVGICVAGGGGGGAPNCCLSLERVLSTCGFDILDLVPVRRQNLDLKAEVLEATGRWLAGQIAGRKG